MANEKRNSTLVLALALLLFFSGGFLLLVKMGMDSRKPETLASGFGSRAASAPAEKATVMDNFKAGAKAAAAKVDDLTGGFLGWADEAPQAPVDYASNSGNENSGAGGEDSFEKYYKNNYAGGESDGWSNDSWEEPPGGSSSGGGVSFGSGGDSSNTYAPRGSSSRGSGTSDDDGWADPAAGKTAAATAAAKGGDAEDLPAASKDAGRALYAALPSSSRAPSTFSDRGSSSSSSSSPQEWAGSGKGSQAARGSLEGMRGSAAAGALDGGAESSKAGGQASYAAGMAGVAAAAKAAAAGNSSSSPSVSKPSASSGGSSGSSDISGGGDDGASALKTAAKTADKAADKTADKAAETKSASTGTEDTSAEDRASLLADQSGVNKDFFGEVVKDRLAGKEVKTEDGSEVTGEPDADLLQDGGILTAQAEPQPLRSKRAAPAEKDPSSFESLTAQRKAELKTRLQVFLKKVENNYGVMKDIYYTSCSSDYSTCRNHGLTQSYLTMITSGGASIAVSLKYSEGKWRPYTLYFRAPARKPAAAKPVAVQPAAEEDDEDTDAYNADVAEGQQE